jgi:hypothetical protein
MALRNLSYGLLGRVRILVYLRRFSDRTYALYISIITRNG